MPKRDTYAKKLKPLRADREALKRFLLAHSGLPGRRPDLDLAVAFADLFEHAGASPPQWDMLAEWVALSSAEAPTNSGAEFLPFSAVQALGAVYLGSDASRREEVFAMLRAASRSERWRTRDAASLAFRRIGEGDFEELAKLLTRWLDRASLGDRRAIVSALAHPPLFEHDGESEVTFALALADKMIAAIRKLTKAGRQTDEYRALAKTLGVAVPIFAAAAPAEGFRGRRRWAEADDRDVKRIVASSIRKARLARHFADECCEVGEILSWGEG